MRRRTLAVVGTLLLALSVGVALASAFICTGDKIASRRLVLQYAESGHDIRHDRG